MKNKFSTLRSTMSHSAQMKAYTKAQAMLTEMPLHSQQPETVEQGSLDSFTEVEVKITNLTSIC